MGSRRVRFGIGRRGIVVLAGVGLVAAAVFGWGRTPVGDDAGRYRFAAAGPGTVEKTVTALGRIRPASYVDVGAQVSGQITRILVEPGDPVEAGQLLIEIDPQVQAAKVDASRAELMRLNAELEEARAQAEFAAEDYDRQERLSRASATSRDAHARARRDMRATRARTASLRAQIAQAQSTLKADEAQLGYTRIFAPMAGTVVSVEARHGQTINANYSAPVLLRIADLATMTIWTQVSEADVTRLHDGMPLYFTTLGHGDRRWTGTLRQIMPAPERPRQSGEETETAGSGAGNVVLYTALFDVPNDAGALRPDMTAQVFFVTEAARDVLVIPVAALEPEEGQPGRYTVRVRSGTRLETRRVEVGLRDRFLAQVVSGLDADEHVVTGVLPGTDGGLPIGFRL